MAEPVPPVGGDAPKPDDHRVYGQWAPERKSEALDLATQYGASKTARLMGIPRTTIVTWQAVRGQQEPK